MLDCHSTLDLVPAMLLDILEADEVRAVRAHLRACPICRIEAEALRPVARAIGLAAPDGGQPSPQLKQRLMAQIDPRPKLVTARAPSRPWFLRPIAVLVPAALALAVVVILGTWALTNQAQLQQQQTRLDRLSRQQVALRQFMLDPKVEPVAVQFEKGASADVALFATPTAFAMAVDGLEPLKGEEVYQCWWYGEQSAAVAGDVFRVDTNGAGVWAWDRPAGNFTVMKVTKEPRSGLSAPTGNVILTANVLQ